MTDLDKSEGTMTASFLPSGGGGGGRVCLPFCKEQKYLSTSTGANTRCIPSLRDPLCTCEAQYENNSNEKKHLISTQISIKLISAPYLVLSGPGKQPVAGHVSKTVVLVRLMLSQGVPGL